VNITMTGAPISQGNGTIDYNEQFTWAYPYWSHKTLIYSYEKGLTEGIPLSMIDVLQNLLEDGERYRFGRYYRVAGYYGFIFLWWAFPFWVMSIILSYSAQGQKASGALLIISGVSMFTAAALWVIIKPYNLQIHLDDEVMTMSFGYSFYVVCSGIFLAFLQGSLMIISDKGEGSVTILIPITALKDNRIGEVVDGLLVKNKKMKSILSKSKLGASNSKSSSKGLIKSASKVFTKSNSYSKIDPSESAVNAKVTFKETNEIQAISSQSEPEAQEKVEVEGDASETSESDDEKEKSTALTPIDMSGELLEIEVFDPETYLKSINSTTSRLQARQSFVSAKGLVKSRATAFEMNEVKIS